MPEAIARARKIATVRQSDHPWGPMTDLELLKSAQLYGSDVQTGEEGLTLAAILLFGTENAILTAIPHHRTDAILRRVNVDRYDDRDDIRTNLLDSHDRLMAFAAKHLNDPFFLEGTQRISLRATIMRELIVNMLIHREYTNAFPAKLIIERNRLVTENANRPHGYGRIDPATFSPFPKNPKIARIFKEIGMADELGSGVRKLYRYSRAWYGHEPEMIEDDIFRVILPLEDEVSATEGDVGEVSGKKPAGVSGDKEASGKSVGNDKTQGKTQGKTEEQILELLRWNPGLSTPELARNVGKSESAVYRAMRKLRESGRLKRVGPAKGGHWEVL